MLNVTFEEVQKRGLLYSWKPQNAINWSLKPCKLKCNIIDKIKAILTPFMRLVKYRRKGIIPVLC